MPDIGATFYPAELYPTGISDHEVSVGGPFITKAPTLLAATAG